MRQRSLGSAGRGTVEWLWQRLTALYLAVFAIGFLVVLALHPVHDFASWKRMFALPSLRIAWVLAFYAMFFHAWIGVRSVYMDYLHSFWLRFLAIAVTATVLLACGVWLILVLFVGGG